MKVRAKEERIYFIREERKKQSTKDGKGICSKKRSVSGKRFMCMYDYVAYFELLHRNL
jgi:hypothetical protein